MRKLKRLLRNQTNRQLTTPAVLNSYQKVYGHHSLTRLLLFTVGGALLPMVMSQETYADDTNRPIRICYFSLNNPKEFVTAKNFISDIQEKAQKMAGPMRPIEVKEFKKERGSAEEDFTKMLDSGIECDGLVISGHHTGSFGGARSDGQLSVDFLEAMSCKPEYQGWFQNIKALWLQGCRTLGVGTITPEEAASDEQLQADFHTARVGQVLEEDSLEIDFAQLNMEFSATLDQDNPLSERYLRIFRRASTFGWTRTAPGENARSELSLLYHMAHMAQKQNIYNVPQPDIIDPRKPVKPEQAVELVTALNSMLTRPDCQQLAVDAWKAHGTIGLNQGIGFDNSDLNAQTSVLTKPNSQAERARALGCTLRFETNPDKIKKAVDDILSDPYLIAANLQPLRELLTRDSELADSVRSKLKSSSNFQALLKKRLESQQTSIYEKLELYSLYREIFGPDKKFEEKIFSAAQKFFSRKPPQPDTQAYYDYRDFMQTIAQSLVKNKLVTDQQLLAALKDPHPFFGLELARQAEPKDEIILTAIAKFLTDQDFGVRRAAVYTLGDIKPTDENIHKQIAKLLTDQDPRVRSRAISTLGRIQPTDEYIHKQIATLLADQDADVRQAAISTLHDIQPTDENIHKLIAKLLTDQNADVRSQAAYTLGNIQPTDENIHKQIAKLLTDQNADVRSRAAYALSNIKPTDEYIRKQIAKLLTDQEPYVRQAAISTLGDIQPTDEYIHKQIAKLLTDQNADVRSHAAYTLFRIQPTDPEVLRMLEPHRFEEASEASE